MDIRKLICLILRDIQKGEKEPKHEDYENVSFEEFANAVQIIHDEHYASNITFAKGGRGNKILVIFMNGAKITMKGLNYISSF